MIFRLQYCNDSGDTAIIDIETKIGVGVQEIEGSGNPFTLKYKTGKSNKSGRFMTSSADIEIYENEFFNIDILKTSNETDIKVSYYINEVLEWQGFILPDFFSKEIKDNAVISMTASDRINTLKAVALSDLPDQIELRELAELCLAKTGLTLPLHTMADFTHVDENNDTLFRTKIQSQRLDDEKGRSISCYDILESILILSNSQLVQRKGVWQIINKYQLEQGVGKNYNSRRGFNNWSKTLHNFEFIGKGAIRTITPVASSVGVFQEYGGGRRYPDNYDFREPGTWIARNGFTFTRDNREILKFANETAFAYTPVFGGATNNYYILNRNYLNYFEANFLNTQAYLQSEKVEIVHNQSKAEINFEINATAPEAFLTAPGLSFVGASVNYAVFAESETQTLVLNKNGKFVPISDDRDNLLRMFFPSNRVILEDVKALTNSQINKGILEVDEGLVSDFKIHIRIYGIPNSAAPTAINFAKFTIKTDQEVAKGTLYKTTQGTDFTREHDIETSIFGDYLTKGLNGYFYDYQNDDTSSLIALNGDKTNLWTAPSETESLPLLQQISRQKARQFSIAHDIVRGDIKMGSFDPLTIFKDCNNYEYVVVSATFDFLRSVANVEIEQILYDGDISRRDYIFSYFGEGESSIKSVGGISGGSSGTGGGGGMTSEQLEMLTNLADWWKLDEENDAIYSEKSVYSLKGVSALGLGSEGGGGGGDFSRLDSWADYTAPKAGWVLSALLGYDLHTRVNDLEARGGADDIGIVVTGAGNAVTGVSKDGDTLTFTRGSTFALNSALTAHISKIDNPHKVTKAQVGLSNVDNVKQATKSEFDTHTSNSTIHITATERTNWNDANSKKHTHANKSVIDALTQGHINVLNKLSLDTQGNVKVDATLWATGGISALGLGDGGSGGGSGVDMLQSWDTYTSGKADYYVPASLLVPFRNDTLSRLTSLESGSATSIVTTGSGNAITSVSKSGNTLTFTKGINFALASHNHDTLYKPIDYVPSWGEITGKPTTFEPSAHTHAISQVTGLQAALNGKEPIFTKNTAFNKNFGTTAGTVAQGNDSRILNGQTAFEWGNHSLAGYYNILNRTDYLTGYVDLNDVPAGVRGLAQGTVVNIPAAGFNDVTTISQYGSNDLLQIVYPFRGDGKFYMRNKGSGAEQWSNWLKIWHSGDFTATEVTNWREVRTWWQNVGQYIKRDAANQALYTDENFYSTKGVSALGLGSNGGGGGGVDMLDSWANYTTAKANYYVPASLLVPFRNDTLSRLTSLESGSATSIVTTGTGNAITSLTKSGSVITATKGLTFALASHTHTIAQITGLQGALDLRATQSDIDTAIDGIEIGGRNYIKSFTNPDWTLVRATVLSQRELVHIGATGQSIVNRSNVQVNIEKGQYTLSGLTKGDLQIVIVLRPVGDKGTQKTYYIDPSEEYKLFEYRFNVVLEEENYTLEVGGNSGIAQGLFFKDIKLEKGTKATDWTPAPEDQVSDWNESNANSFSYIKNKPTQLSQFTDNIGVGSHIANKSNPHAVTKAQVGLGNADNTSDANKPISTATQTALNTHFSNGTANAKHLTDAQLAYLNDLIGWWKVDASGNLYTEKNLYSTKGVSALGFGEGGSGGGVDMLDSWANYTTAKANYYVPASLLVPFRNDTLSRLTSLESGSATSIVTTGSGNAITSLTKSGTVITADKGLTFALASHNHDTLYKPIGYVPSWSEITGKPSTFVPSAHTHTIAQVTGLQTALDGKEPLITKNTAFNKNFGTVAGTVAQGNDSRILNGQTAFGWGNFRDYGLGRTNAVILSEISDTIESGFYAANNQTLNNPLAYSSVLYVNYAQAERYNALFLGNTSNRIIHRQHRDGNSTDVELWHTGNLTSLSQLTDNIGVATHIANKANPHNVTKAQVGLHNVDNLSMAQMFSYAVLTEETSIEEAYIDYLFIPNGATIKNWTIRQVGTELHFLFNDVVKQRMLSDGTILGTGGITALST